MPDLSMIVMVLAAGFGSWVLWVVGWLASIVCITWLYDGAAVARGYCIEELNRLREFGL
jgi:hypothetical protein